MSCWPAPASNCATVSRWPTRLQPCCGAGVDLDECVRYDGQCANTPASTATATNRCTARKANNLVAGNTTAEQAASALAALVTAGWETQSNVLQALHYSFAALAVALTYASSYGRFSVKDKLRGYSFAATGGATSAKPNALVPASANALATSFGSSNGVPPIGPVGINIVNNLSQGGPLLDAAWLSAGGC